MLSTTPLRLYLEENQLLSLPALQVAPGEVLTLMGPSGCGKSSLLAALAGVLPASGPLRLEGDVILDARRLTQLPPQARRIGMLFQDDLLFDHLTVAENLMFGMPASVKGHRARREKAVATLAQVDLTNQADKLPGALSGGQKARVSLLRALLAEPEALLLDEPFSRLDKPLRAAFRELVFAQIKALAIPAILVTHDEDDAPGTILQLTESRF
ncbi:ATP-binding cassette domain-containing protein [Aeromonas hydrophila]|uniref:ATP-binding cassette domain-containing protein n=1 Tax=Aeromonas TaxID=642 RepID=UPI001603E527|nr:MULTISPECIES: ATP-binding cassette domain-containing protein [Aeromonas]HEB4994067.1 ATP-binding cassette domain-containing protein [Aeromonas hydrophila subsp. hydrophila]MCK0185231.1 ATP-binding cassette domain-containing protein [Aeromonas hydrophila]MCP3241458.1 ATP-binding cassette domain-containing protein [Aeromonas hydrophila]UCM56199.1 ATP-binding cassette domain-containing protein [Aeromonas hydrophila]UOV90619.1 ATP-binding cassette domain-containing protein [Aeromonas hydrophila